MRLVQGPLYHCIQDLFIATLWQEYEFGYCWWEKAAKHFTAVEQGKVKYNYHRRKVVWDTIAKLV
jgi:hypothetical protein